MMMRPEDAVRADEDKLGLKPAIRHGKPSDMHLLLITALRRLLRSS